VNGPQAQRDSQTFTELFVHSEQNMKRNCLISIAGLILGGCTISAPVKIGTETYTLASRTTLGNDPGARAEVMQKAGEFCSTRGGSLSVVSERSTDCALPTACAKVELTFSCVDAGEPKKRGKK
jgi:hypothetical protein